jgi:Regulator of ribonuclease activity B
VKKFLISMALACCLLSDPAVVSAQGSKITIDQLQRMFDNIRAKTAWNVDGPLLWGYYFTDPNPKKLEGLADELTRRGYYVVDVHAVAGKPWYVLHVERAEHHSPQSLNERNQDFYRLAEEHQLRSYDGMDVGPLR